MSVSIQSIKELIEESWHSSMKKPIYPQTYSEIVASAFEVEFKNNCKTLTTLFKWCHTHRELLETNFLNLCLAREQQIQNTCFSFTATPKSSSNQLYWLIAYELFQPKTLKAMCGILLPSIQKLLSIDIGYYQKERLHHPVILCEELDLRTSSYLEEPVDNESSEQLGHYVLADGVILPTSAIEHFSFALHKECYKALEHKYPRIHQKLYQYTDETKQLVLDIEQFECMGVTPKEKLTQFMHILSLSGAHYTNDEEEAAIEASFAFKEFLRYLDSLPPLFANELLNMKNDNKLTLRMVIANLKKPASNSGCVEMNADHIKYILQNPENETLLQQIPALSQKLKETILQRYRNKPMSIFGTEQTNKIPDNILKKLFTTTTINKELQLIDFLIHLSIEEYPLLFNNSVLELKAKWGKSVLLLPEKKANALRNLLLENYEKYGSKNKPFIKAICNVDDENSAEEEVESSENAPEAQAVTTAPSNKPELILTGYIFTTAIGTLLYYKFNPPLPFFLIIMELLVGFWIYDLSRNIYDSPQTEAQADAPSIQPQIS